MKLSVTSVLVLILLVSLAYGQVMEGNGKGSEYPQQGEMKSGDYLDQQKGEMMGDDYPQQSAGEHITGDLSHFL